MRKFVAVSSAVAVVALSVAGCSSESESDSPKPVFRAASEQQTESTEQTQQQADPQPVVTETVTAENEEEECADGGSDLQTRFANGAKGVLNTNQDGFKFHYTVIDGAYDPCAELSYAVLGGALGGENGPAGTGASIADGILIWSEGELVGPDPRKVDTSGVSYAAWVSVADVSASKSSGARRLHQECRLRVL
ncbi:hypothetical protein I6I73_07385 [Corynebacterium striatum]|uniref:hypothetical protein n=1 Tax=Corynebacterium striatum TaxID=43770 RepID=UPI00191CCA31|nr:hypothetical protein [Corynebacterium striatum]QQU78620.1 hypothetical protein I6I73_07385 [Corynebacterium striatum]